MDQDGVKRRRFARWLPVTIFLLVPVALVIGVLVHIQVTSGPAPTRPSNMIATGEVNGRNVAVVAYETDTFPRIDLFRIGSIGYSVQVEAFDLDSGESLWDTMLSNEHPSIGAEALAVGGKYAYVRTDRGLVILRTADGAIAYRDDGIPGLGGDHVEARSAYGWDADAQQIVLLDADGDVRGIPVGTDTVVDVAAEVVERWRSELKAKDEEPLTYYESTSNATRNTARLPGPKPTPDPLTGIVPDDGTVHAFWAPDDAWSANMVIDQESGLAAGSEFGFVVSESSRFHTHTLQVADPVDGQVHAQYVVESGSGIENVAVHPAGYVIMVLPDEHQQAMLVIATADSIRASAIGERGWFGS